MSGEAYLLIVCVTAKLIQAVVSGHGLALLDELAKPEIDAGQLVG